MSSSRASSRASPKASTIYSTTPQSTASYFTDPVSYVVSGLYRRLTEPLSPTASATPQAMGRSQVNSSTNGFYSPPPRTASPFAPPPLTGLSLRGIRGTSPSAQILTRTLAEEIRLLLPPRLQLATDWTLAYSIEQDGVSLATLYDKCKRYQNTRHGFVLVVKDGVGGIFGAYLTDAPRPSPHYFGTGECFLWRSSILPTPNTASILSSLPPPPSADTTNLQRSTTITSTNARSEQKDLLSPWSPKTSNTLMGFQESSGTSTPERIRFKAFPYSGVNDYMIFCEADYLSVGAGDGRYGLWLDSVLERGISSECLTFGNEGLSEEGEKFEVVGVEVWYIGS